MLLILITLAAAASLAVIVSQAEKKAATLQAYQSMVADEKLVITGITPELNGTIDKSSLNSLFITVQNLNTNSSQLTTIIVNGRPCDSLSLVSVNGINNPSWSTNLAYKYNLNKNYIIPAQATVVFNLNFTNISYPLIPQDYSGGYAVGINKSIAINIMTPYNVFDKTFNSPNAVAHVKVQTQDLGNFKRDYLYLDGTGSASDGSIVGWQWNIANDTMALPLKQGETCSVYLPSSGPWTVNLTVIDSNNMISMSDNIVIPEDDSFCPLAHITWKANASLITLNVTDVENKPVSGVYINLLPQDSSIDLSVTDGQTQDNGTFKFQVLNGTGAIVVTASDNSGSLSKTITITKSGPLPPQTPVANFTADNVSGPVPYTVNFTDTSINSPTFWQWNFGDGAINASQNPVHTYTSTGIFTVTLNCSNAAGFNVSQKIGYVTVTLSSPAANFSSNVTSGHAPLAVQFWDNSTGLPNDWHWTFGDGNVNDTSRNPVNVYSNPGLYTVILIVNNGVGSNTTTKTDYIEVMP